MNRIYNTILPKQLKSIKIIIAILCVIIKNELFNFE